MKKYKYILLMLSVTLLGSCELDLLPESEKTYSGFWAGEEEVGAAHMGIYSKYRDYIDEQWQMGELRSDVWGGNTIESPFGQELIDNNISTTIVHFNNWANFYGLMHYINDFIKNAPTVPFGDQARKDHMIAQIYGIRAQVYYTMLRAWGDVPITTEPLLEVDLQKLKKPRSPKSEVMDQIKDDLAMSLQYFGDDDSKWNGKNVYWSKAATLALKGDVYLWSGKVLGGGSSDFTEAKAALSQVSGYSLVNYAELWGYDFQDNDEFIFAMDFFLEQADNFYGNFTGRAVDLESLYDEDGESLADFIINGASRFGPSDKTNLLIDDLDDMRRSTFMKLYDDGANHVPFVANNPSYKGAVLNKFLGVVGSDGLRQNNNNVPVYRYADVLLMLAEAKNNLNEDPSAEINLVRERAYGENFAGHEYTNASQSENAKAILDERYKEFIGEGKRWWDLVRAGETFVFDEVPSMDQSEAYKIYYSISESMLANDEMLEQTEGYN